MLSCERRVLYQGRGLERNEFGAVAKPIDRQLTPVKQACELLRVTIHSMCKTLTRTRSLSCETFLTSAGVEEKVLREEDGSRRAGDSG